MYQFSRAVYREVAAHIKSSDPDAHIKVLQACERNLERLVTDRHYFARPARTLFNDIRVHFPMTAQMQVWHVVVAQVEATKQWLDEQPRNGCDANGNPLQCRATTRRGTACQRMPMPENGYCPSHQHLADTEERELETLAA